jgi:hypothetical protein
MIVWLGYARPACANSLGTNYVPEAQMLARLFDDATSSIDIRCSTLSDRTVLAALERARKRGARVRIVADTISPPLARMVSRHHVRFLVHLLRKAQRGKYLSPNIPIYMAEPSAQYQRREQRLFRKMQSQGYADVDGTEAWFGTPRWSRNHWIGISMTHVHTQHPDPKEGTASFLQAWKHSDRCPQNVRVVKVMGNG